MGYADLGIGGIAKYFSFVATDDFLLFFVFDDLSVVYAVFVEKLWYGIFVLVVAVCVDGNFVFVGWLLGSFCDLFVKFITGGLYPFADGKCYEQSSFSFNVEIGVCITFFILVKACGLNFFLFFLTKLQNSSISCVPSLTSLMRKQVTS
mgnify:CR=1 FL=1